MVRTPIASPAFDELRLLRQLVEIKLAAAQVEGVGVLREFFAERLCERVDALLALLFDFEQSGLLKDSQVLGDVVGRDVQSFTQFGDRLRTTNEEAHQPETRWLTQRTHGGEAVE